MNIKYAIIGIVLIASMSTASATVMDTWCYDEDGLGVFSASGSGTFVYGGGLDANYYNNNTPLYFNFYISSTNNNIYPPYPGGYHVHNHAGRGGGAPITFGSGVGSLSSSAHNVYMPWDDDEMNLASVNYAGSGYAMTTELTMVVSEAALTEYTASGTYACVDGVVLYIKNSASVYAEIGYNDTSPYSFTILDGHDYRLVFYDGVYYDFTCTGDVVFDYDACIYVYGYTCGIDTIKLRDNNSQLIETVYQSTGYDVYEMQIVDGEEYTISFYDMGIILCYNQTFTCTGSHVPIDYDRCNWVYPPNGADVPIYLWSGYDYNIVLLKDNHGNLVENGKLAIYDKTDNVYIQKWADNAEGYALLGAMFPADHDVRMMFRTFDGTFTLDTTYPANGTALVGEEDITTTNWTIPIKYNINILPVDIYAVPLFDVFCGLSEYTPLDPQAFWGMDLSDQGYVPVSNCSGFAMCDIIAEKEGYADYKEEALDWASKSALAKDYRHNIVMEEE